MGFSTPPVWCDDRKKVSEPRAPLYQISRLSNPWPWSLPVKRDVRTTSWFGRVSGVAPNMGVTRGYLPRVVLWLCSKSSSGSALRVVEGECPLPKRYKTQQFHGKNRLLTKLWHTTCKAADRSLPGIPTPRFAPRSNHADIHPLRRPRGVPHFPCLRWHLLYCQLLPIRPLFGVNLHAPPARPRTFDHTSCKYDPQLFRGDARCQ